MIRLSSIKNGGEVFKELRKKINDLDNFRKILFIVIPSLILISSSVFFLFKKPEGLQTFIGDQPGLMSGVFPGEQTITSLQAYETLVGRKQDIFLFFANWGSGYGIQTAKDAIANGTTPMLTWEPHGKTLDNINAGTYDSYIRSYAQGLKTVPGTVLLRPMHEMNGNWYDWGYPVPTNSLTTGNTPQKFVTAWQHIYNIYQAEGATNVKFVWSPNNEGPPNWNASNFKDYYPGDAYVQYAAIDAYNFGTSASWSNWRSFDSLFKNAYTTITSFTTKPILVGETASTELGGDKSAWIRDAFNIIKSSYPQIKGIVWFHVNKEADWRVNSSERSLFAFKDEMSKLAPIVTKADTTLPTISLTSPVSGATVSGAISLAATATDNVGVSKVEFYLDSVLKNTDTTSAYGYSLDTTTLTSGSHTALAKAYDLAGNVAQASVSFTVSNTQPVPTTSTTTTTNLHGTVLGGASSLQSNNFTKTGNVNIQLKWNGSGNLDVELLDPSGAVVASSKTTNKPELISKSLSVTGVYKIKTINNGSKKTNYTLTVTQPK